MKKRIILTGASGYIGSQFLNLKPKEFDITEVTHDRLDITDSRLVHDFFSKNDAPIVVHLAAKTHIDACETDRPLKNIGQTWKVNILGTKNIIKACLAFNKRLIYLSTECVFDGRKPFYTEKDNPHPINWYGETKKIAEEMIKKDMENYVILRSVLTYGNPNNNKNDLIKTFARTLQQGRKLKAVTDQRLSITYIDDLINTIHAVVNSNMSGIYHFAGSEIFTPFDIAQIVKRTLRLTHGEIVPVTLKEFFNNRKKLRLRNAVLSSAKIRENLNVKTTPLKTVLNRIL